MHERPDRKHMIVPPDRSYMHLQCQQVTTVNDDPCEDPSLAHLNHEAHTGLSDPLRPINTRTYCSACENVFRIDQFIWTDSGETIHDFRVRWRTKLPTLVVIVTHLNFLLALAAVFAFTGLFAGAAAGVLMGGGWLSALLGLISPLVFAYIALQLWSRLLLPMAEHQAKTILRIGDFRQLI